MRHILSLVLLVAYGTTLAQGVAPQPAAPPTYNVTVLSSAGAIGNSIDDVGLVAGRYTLPNMAVHASLWAFGKQIDLGTLGQGSGLSSMVQWPVKNDLGIISGISLTDQLDPNKEGWSCAAFLPNPNLNVCLGFVWDPLSKRMRALPTLGGTNGFATGTNNLGETVGWAESAAHDPSCVPPQVLQFSPVVWGPGRDAIHPLPLIGTDSSGAATALNDRGQIVGISGACGTAVGGVSAAHAVIWENGVATEIKNPNGAPYWNTPMMINQQGVVVGFVGTPGDSAGDITLAFIWTRRGGFAFLPLLQGDVSSTATSVNARGQVVGFSNDAAGNLHPWIWENGVTRNLNGLLEPGSGLTGPIVLAFDINDEGQITGTTSTSQAIVATPVR
jgi:probable HAF family extracellular repeat protein